MFVIDLNNRFGEIITNDVFALPDTKFFIVCIIGLFARYHILYAQSGKWTIRVEPNKIRYPNCIFDLVFIYGLIHRIGLGYEDTLYAFVVRLNLGIYSLTIF